MADEIFDITDENNNVVGKELRDIVHTKGLLHRSVNIFVFNSRGEMFLQKRSQNKKICPGRWDLSASEHLIPDETYENGAKRGLKEELGIDAKITEIRDVHLLKNEFDSGKIKDCEFVKTYKIIYDGKITIDKKEVAEGRFFTRTEIKQMLAENKSQFTPWFLTEWEWFSNKA